MRITIKVVEQKKSKGLGVPVGLIKWKWKQHQTNQTLPKKDQPLKLSAQTKEHLLVKLQRGQWWLWRSCREWSKGESVNHIKSSGEHRSHYSNRPSAHPTHCIWDGNGSATFTKYWNTKLQIKNCMGMLQKGTHLKEILHSMRGRWRQMCVRGKRQWSWRNQPP